MGIEVANGKYLAFLDSDDYWDDKTALEKIYEIIQDDDIDLVTFRRKKFFEDKSEFVAVGNSIDDLSSNNFSLLIKTGNLNCSACNKIVKKGLFDKYDLTFEKGVFSEDVEWCARLLACTNTIKASNLDFYIYRQRLGSITHTIGEKNINDLKGHIEKINVISKEVDDDKKRIIDVYLAEQFCNFVITVSSYKHAKNELVWIKERLSYLKGAVTKKAKILKLMCKILGVKISIKLIGKLR